MSDRKTVGGYTLDVDGDNVLTAILDGDRIAVAFRELISIGTSWRFFYTAISKKGYEDSIDIIERAWHHNYALGSVSFFWVSVDDFRPTSYFSIRGRIRDIITRTGGQPSREDLQTWAQVEL